MTETTVNATPAAEIDEAAEVGGGTAVGPVRPPEDACASGVGRWLVSRFEEVEAMLTDPRLSAAHYPTDCAVIKDASSGCYSSEEQTALGIMRQTMLAADPPEHTRLRKPAVRTFAARRLDDIRPRLEQIAEELLDELPTSGTIDLLTWYGFPMAVRGLAALVGLPEEVSQRLLPPSDQRDRAIIPLPVMHAAATEWIDIRRRHPADDLVGALIAAHDKGELSDDELTAVPLILLIGGMLTTIHMIGNGVYLLLQHPKQLAELRRDPSLVPAAVNEVLRHSGPVAYVSRYAVEDLEIGGAKIPAGSFVRALLHAANHDPQRFPDPDTFNIHRPIVDDLAFGHGIHYCIGARLARLEAEVTIGALVRRFPDLELAEPVKFTEVEKAMVGLERLPVRLCPTV